MGDTHVSKTESDLSALIAFARSSLAVQAVKLADGEVASVPDPQGGRKLVSLESFREELRDAPKRARGTAQAATLQSFIDLVNRHKDESSALFGDFSARAPALVAVIDYHRTD